jgi:hypothetical protein
MRCIVFRKALQGGMVGYCETTRSCVMEINIGRRSLKFEMLMYSARMVVVPMERRHHSNSKRSQFVAFCFFSALAN